MAEQWLDQWMTLIEQSYRFAPLLAFIAGILTSVTPCCLSNISLIIGFVGGTGEYRARKAFTLSLFYALGSTMVFVALGMAASLVGKVIEIESFWWYLALGVIMTLMALQTFGVCNLIPHIDLTVKNAKKGYFGAVTMGMVGGIFSSSCATPVLVVLLLISAEKGSFAGGIILLLLYSAGHSVLTVLAGTSVGFVHNVACGGKYGTLSRYAKTVLGCIILFMGFVMFYVAFFHIHTHG